MSDSSRTLHLEPIATEAELLVDPFADDPPLSPSPDSSSNSSTTITSDPCDGNPNAKSDALFVKGHQSDKHNSYNSRVSSSSDQKHPYNQYHHHLHVYPIPDGPNGAKGYDIGTVDDIDASSRHSRRGRTSFAASAKRSFSRRSPSRKSIRSYISNISAINRKNLARFGKSKVSFLVFNSLYTLVGLLLITLAATTFSGNYSMSPLVLIVRRDLFLGLTIVAAAMIVTGIIGFSGAFLHRKRLLTTHSMLLAPILIGLIVIGFMSFKQRNDIHWDREVAADWGELGDNRRVIQDLVCAALFQPTKATCIDQCHEIANMQFQCCGYFSSYDRPFVDDTCANYQDSTHASTLARRSSLWPRQNQVPNIPEVPPTADQIPNTPDPADDGIPIIIPDTPTGRVGCLQPWKTFASRWLLAIYCFCFAMVPLSFVVFIVGILAANHIYD
ncbi:hypothetical protein HDV00_004151 [Rhizophlyctis rosea]|nr:hypothetical protein HDV00_004151 [Rhizophlyctis rosea]